MNQPIANYTRLRECFTDLLYEPCHQRILLLEGESGIGKTTLLSYFWQQAIAQQRPVVLLDLEAEARDVYDFFWQHNMQCKEDELTHLTTQLAKDNTSSPINASHLSQQGQGNEIHIVSQHSPPSEPAQARQLLNAWQEDMATIQQPFVLLLDNIDKAEPEFQQWLNSYVVPTIINYSSLRVVFAGETVPAPTPRWQRLAQKHRIAGVTEARHWLEFADQKGYRLPESDPEKNLAWMTGICRVLAGQPHKIIQILEGFR